MDRPSHLGKKLASPTNNGKRRSDRSEFDCYTVISETRGGSDSTRRLCVVTSAEPIFADGKLKLMPSDGDMIGG
jgi:hypothetical protein